MQNKKHKAKLRLDVLLFELGLVASVERASALVLAGRVLVKEQKVDKPGTQVAADSAIRLLGADPPYVSRGGVKLAHALKRWQIAVDGRVCIDVGTSTGGFTDCLLQQGAAQVTAIDTGFGQIAMKLRQDPRVRLMERTNARLLEPGVLAARPEEKQATLMVMDVSFISSIMLLEPVFAAATDLTEAIVLVKPQFEVERGQVEEGGIVRDSAAHQQAINKVAENVRSLGWEVVETIDSPITGTEGNKEFLLYAKRPLRS